MMIIEFPDDVVRIFTSLPDHPSTAGTQEAVGQLGTVESTTEEPTLAEIQNYLTELSGLGRGKCSFWPFENQRPGKGYKPNAKWLRTAYESASQNN